MNNTPDDWGNYFRTCSAGHRYHASEYHCGECEAITEGLAASIPCNECGEYAPAELWKWQRDGGYWAAECPGCEGEIFR